MSGSRLRHWGGRGPGHWEDRAWVLGLPLTSAASRVLLVAAPLAPVALVAGPGMGGRLAGMALRLGFCHLCECDRILVAYIYVCNAEDDINSSH